MIAERSNRLVLLVLLASLALLARLFEIQVTEHELWAEQASRLVHAGRVIPHRRGRVLDAKGRVLAHDVDAYHLVLSYREFRRGHPVGQVAHARSALELRAVSLREAFDWLVDWAEELVTLSPAQLDAFAEGAALRTATLEVPATDRPEDEHRFGRAADLRFYVYRLLAPEPKELGGLRQLIRDRGEVPYTELLSEVRGEDVLATLREKWNATRESLSLLAGLFWLEGAPEYADKGERLGLLIAELEESRRAVESAVASSLFEEAAGFPPGRVAPGTLRTYFDLEPIRRVLRWSPADVERWTRETRVRWLGWRAGYALPRLLAQLTLDPARTPGPDDVLSALATVFQNDAAFDAALGGEPPDWREFDQLKVFARLDSIFRADPGRDLDPRRIVALPIQKAALRGFLGPPAERWGLLDKA
ncbi:MAG: hypothetical protein O7B99_06175, partial [Planctomycetota bacterium]|nr:hypothetical protein [Planctomycetota bacterium]